MLVPHRREDAELGECRRAAKQLKDALIFVWLQAVIRGEGLVDLRFLNGGRGGGHGGSRLRTSRSRFPLTFSGLGGE